MSFFDEFERSYTGDQNKKDKKEEPERAQGTGPTDGNGTETASGQE